MRLAIVAGLLAAALAAGCGGPAKLTDDEQQMVATAEADMASTVVDGSYYAATLRDVDRLVALYRAKPGADYDGRTMRQVLQDAASTLDDTQPDLAAKLDRAAS